MGAIHWGKLWLDLLDDPKTGPLPDRLWRRFVELILVAKEYDQEGKLPPLELIAWRLRLLPAELEADLMQLEEHTSSNGFRPVVTNRNEDELLGFWYLPGYPGRQRAMKSAERMAKKRAYESRPDYYGESEDEIVTDRNNEPVTDRNLRGRGRIKEVKEEEEEEEKEEENPAHPFLENKEFAQLWAFKLEQRKQKKGKSGAMTRRAQTMMLNKLHKYPEGIACSMLRESLENDWSGVHPPKNYKPQLTGSDYEKSLKSFGVKT